MKICPKPPEKENSNQKIASRQSVISVKESNMTVS